MLTSIILIGWMMILDYLFSLFSESSDTWLQMGCAVAILGVSLILLGLLIEILKPKKNNPQQ